MQTLLRRSRAWVLCLASAGSLLALDACDLVPITSYAMSWQRHIHAHRRDT